MPLEIQIKPILDRIHLVRDLINRAEYEEKCGPSDPDCASQSVKLQQALPEIESDLDPDCLRQNIKPIVFIIGGPASTKENLAKKIENKYYLTRIALGELMQIEIENQTPLGQRIALDVEEGNLVETDIVIWMLKREMLNQFRKSYGFVIEGFPKTVDQLIRFENEVARAHVAFYLHVDKEIVANRVASAKIENRTVVLKKLCLFRKYTTPLKHDCGKRLKFIHDDDDLSSWTLADKHLANMMVDWNFLKNNVAGVSGESITEPYQVVHLSDSSTSQLQKRNSVRQINMYEILGGLIPYHIRMDCTRTALPFLPPLFGIDVSNDEAKKDCTPDLDVITCQ